MEIKIAESIQTLEYLRDSGIFPFSSKEGVLYTAGSIDVAISTMNKYQKIQEIMSKRPKDMISSNPTLRAISEVLEDEY